MIEGADRDLLARSMAHAVESSTGEALDVALGEVGWRDALVDDPRTAVSLLFELQGRTGASSSSLDLVLATGLGRDLAPVAAVVLPKMGGVEAPGRARGEALDADGIGTPGLARASTTIVVCETDGVVECRMVSTDLLTVRPISGLDPSLGLVRVTATDVPGTASPLPAGAWANGVALGQRAVAHELIGASRAMLALARDHAVERIQFDQPIAGFQAVRHRLADAHVAVETADAAIDAAWDDGSSLAAAAAKAIAGRSARLVARHAQQVLAGIGFTTEHPLHRYVTRVLVLDGLLGDARSLTRSLGGELLRARQLPAMLPL
ncbi:MAG: acyl-CoA dehydrogenase family protein [Acidimicrobiales bacterium]